MPTGIRYRRAKARLRVTLWVIPMLYAVGAIVLAAIVLRMDSVDPVDFGPDDIDPSSASTTLAALGSGMIVFTGFVTSVVLMVVQFGSTQFSPRFLRWFRTEPTLKLAGRQRSDDSSTEPAQDRGHAEVCVLEVPVGRGHHR